MIIFISDTELSSARVVDTSEMTSLWQLTIAGDRLMRRDMDSAVKHTNGKLIPS